MLAGCWQRGGALRLCSFVFQVHPLVDVKEARWRFIRFHLPLLFSSLPHHAFRWVSLSFASLLSLSLRQLHLSHHSHSSTVLKTPTTRSLKAPPPACSHLTHGTRALRPPHVIPVGYAEDPHLRTLLESRSTSRRFMPSCVSLLSSSLQAPLHFASSAAERAPLPPHRRRLSPPNSGHCANRRLYRIQECHSE